MPRKRKDEQDPDAAIPEAAHTAVASEPEPETPVDPPHEAGSNESEESEPESDSTPEAQVAVTMRGPSSAVRKAAAKFGAAPGQPRVPIREPEPEDPYVELLADPRNMVIVTREEPEMVDGQKLRPVKKKINCPTSVERVADKIFRDFGGHIFRLSIHPNTPNGETKILGALTIENPDTAEPWYPEDVRQQELPPAADSLDPTTTLDNDPIVVAEQAMQRRARVLAQKIRTKELERTMRDFDKDDEGADRGKKRDEEGDRLSRAERRLEEAAIETRVGSQISELKSIIERQNETIQRLAAAPQKGSGDDKFIAMMQMMSKQSTDTMMMLQQSNAQVIQAITAMNKTPKEDPLDQMLKLKQIMGNDDSRRNRFDSVVEEFMIERLMGGNDNVGPEDDAVKLLIKQGIPAFKELMNAKIENDKRQAGPGLSDAQVKEITENAKKTAVEQFFAKLKAEGKMIALPPPGRPAESQAAAAKPTSEEDNVNLPPGPTSSAYDQKASVNFVLSTLIDDIQKGCPKDSFAAGDCLDRLDEDLLTGISSVSTGEDLEKLLSPFADPTKISYIKEAGKNDAVASWIRSVINTVRSEYLQELKKAASK